MKRALQMRFVKTPRDNKVTGTTTSHVDITPETIREYVHMGAVLFAAMYGSKKLIDTVCAIAELKFTA